MFPFVERTYSMWVPGFGTEDPKQYKKFLSNDLLKAVNRCREKCTSNLLFYFSHWKHLICRQQRILKAQPRNNNRLNRVNYGNALFFSLSSVYIVKNEIKSCIYISILDKTSPSFSIHILFSFPSESNVYFVCKGIFSWNCYSNRRLW